METDKPGEHRLVEDADFANIVGAPSDYEPFTALWRIGEALA